MECKRELLCAEMFRYAPTVLLVVLVCFVVYRSTTYSRFDWFSAPDECDRSIDLDGDGTPDCDDNVPFVEPARKWWPYMIAGGLLIMWQAAECRLASRQFTQKKMT